MHMETATVPSPRRADALRLHLAELGACTRCPNMVGPVVMGRPVLSPVMLLGQAPGAYEGKHGRPFAWTAGKTLFKWFAELGLGEEEFRDRVYMAAVCRCFPGKNPKGGDRVPERDEVERCSRWLHREIELVRPRLLLPVGKLAISQVIQFDKLSDVVGRVHRIELHGHSMDTIPLPHPSGASTWHRTEPGKTLLAGALALVAGHEAFRAITNNDSRTGRPRP
jgi:uracil-DNA glycosylase